LGWRADSGIILAGDRETAKEKVGKMTLRKYQDRRNFSRTKEPSGERTGRPLKKKIFVVQKHQATTLHYDLRLEERGVLKSWAIPKKPPREKGLRRLAVATEDHPLEYGNFSGQIPAGQYGAGQVEIWDRGELRYLKREENEIVVKLSGKKLAGRYALIHPPKFKEGQWLFFRVGQ
jgi:DNA ligase D-like protein (predicted 3'-phosphoesterase)